MANKKIVKKKNKRKLFIAILMILFTGIILTASTYAWFTSNQTVTVEDIDVNVAASQGLQISVDAINWKSIVSADEIRATNWSGVTNQIPILSNSIVPTSTIGEIDESTGFMKMFTGDIVTGSDAVSKANILTTQRSTEVNGNNGAFVAFDLFFQVVTETKLYLTSNSKVTYKGDTSTGIENASRVAFVFQGNLSPGASAANLQALKAGADAAKIIWEPNVDAHTAAGVKNALDVYGLTTSQAGATALDYYGVKDVIPQGADILLNSNDETYFGPVVPDIRTGATTGISAGAYEELFTLPAGVSKIRIYMWIEGQDVDCENNASGGSLTYSLQFSSLESA